MRMIDCEDYMDFVEQLLEINDSKYYEFNIGNYEFEIYDNFEKMYSKIREKDKKYKLSRMISGISDKWDKTDNSEYDIWIQGKGYKWNSEVKEWINSDNAINEIGCIHTVQGYDLNYAGVIFGKEISYDEKNKKIIIIPENYQDAKGKAGISNNQTELKRYILNIYRVLLTRGIRGTFVYAMDENFNRYLKRVARKIRKNEDRKISYMKAADESQDYKLEKKKKCKR